MGISYTSLQGAPVQRAIYIFSPLILKKYAFYRTLCIGHYHSNDEKGRHATHRLSTRSAEQKYGLRLGEIAIADRGTMQPNVLLSYRPCIHKSAFKKSPRNNFL